MKSTMIFDLDIFYQNVYSFKVPLMKQYGVIVNSVFLYISFKKLQQICFIILRHQYFTTLHKKGYEADNLMKCKLFIVDK